MVCSSWFAGCSSPRGPVRLHGLSVQPLRPRRGPSVSSACVFCLESPADFPTIPSAGFAGGSHREAHDPVRGSQPSARRLELEEGRHALLPGRRRPYRRRLGQLRGDRPPGGLPRGTHRPSSSSSLPPSTSSGRRGFLKAWRRWCSSMRRSRRR